MPRERKPPVAALVVGAVVAAAIVLVVVNRTAKRRPAPAPEVVVEMPPSVLAQAAALEAGGNLPDAYATLRPYLDEHPDNLDALMLLRRVLPRGDKSELATRLGRCSNPDAAFDELYTAARTDGDALGLRVLLGWLKANRPDDHRWACAEIEEKVAAKDYAAATEQYRARLGVAGNESTQAQMFLTYLDAMQAAGQTVAAYAAVPDADARAAFARLAHRLEVRLLSDTAAARPSLRELIAAHRKRSPGDPKLWLAEGALLEAAGDFEKAQKVYADGQAILPPPAEPRSGDLEREREVFRLRRVECFCRLNQHLRAYDELGQADRTFHQLASRLAAEKKADVLAELVKRHRAKIPDDALPFWDAELLFLRGEYAKAAAALEAFRAGKRANLPERWKVYDRLVRSHLRNGDPAAAARAMADTQAAALALGAPLGAAVRAATGDSDLLAQSLAAVPLAHLYDDEDFAREIAAPRYAELRKKYPDPRKK